MSLQDCIRYEVSRLVDDLVHGRIAELAMDGRIGRLTEPDVRRVLAQYPGQLTQPGMEALEDLKLVQLRNARVSQYALDFDLWMDGHRSDLTLSCTLTAYPTGEVGIEMDDLRVM